MAIPSELHGLLLELHYDLLPDEEAAALRQRIASDPDVAKAWREVQQTASLLQAAARAPVSEPPLRFSAPSEPNPSPATSNEAVLTRRRIHWGRWINASIAVAASVLMLVSVAGYFSIQSVVTPLSKERTRVIVAMPEKVFETSKQPLAISTTTLEGAPVVANVTARLVGNNDQPLFEESARTDANGQLWMDVTVAQRNRHSKAQLLLAVERNGMREELLAAMDVESAPISVFHSTDRPHYRPGETVYYRALLLNRSEFTPVSDGTEVKLEIKGPSEDTLPGSERNTRTDKGVASGSFHLPDSLAGGRYTLDITSPQGTFDSATRSFQVHDFRVPRLKKELEFGRDSFGPGDHVVADFSATRAEGGAAVDATVHVVASIDRQTVFQEGLKTDLSGTVRVEFDLPKKLESADAQLAVIVDDGGTRETIVRRIPILLKSVDVRFYPEGGELVAGLENRVYFEAMDTLATPMHVEGDIVDPKGMVVAKVATEHEGRGAFRFTPKLGEAYSLRVTQPADVVVRPALPVVVDVPRIVLSSSKPVYESLEPLTLYLGSRDALRPLVVTAVSGGAVVGQTSLITKEGSNAISFPLSADAAGVLRVTVHDCTGVEPTPLVERLVYRRPSRRLVVTLTDASPRYAPGQPVQLTLEAKDENGNAARGLLGVAVVDDALLTLAKDKAAALPTYFYLTSEIRGPEEIEDANFFLVEGTKAASALDLLLGTRGWSRIKGSADRDEYRATSLGKRGFNSPIVLDNLATVASGERTRSLALTRAWFSRLANLARWGGLGLCVLGVVALLLRCTRDRRSWIPAIGLAGACAIVGFMILPSPDREALDAKQITFHEPLDVSLAAAIDMPHEMLEPAAEALDMDIDHPQRLNLALGGDGNEQLRQLKEQAADVEKRFGWFSRHPELEVTTKTGVDLLPSQELLDRIGRAFAEEKTKQRFVREYAHRRRAGNEEIRSDFAPTLYWNPLLETDENGFAKIAFDLSDAVTTYRVLVDGHDMTGRLGTGGGEIVSRLPMSIEPKTPVELAVGDWLELPVAVVSDTTHPLEVRVETNSPPSLVEQGPKISELQIAPESRGRAYFNYVAKLPGTVEITLLARATPSEASLFGAAEEQPARALATVPMPTSAPGAEAAEDGAAKRPVVAGSRLRRMTATARTERPSIAPAQLGQRDLARGPDFQDRVQKQIRIAPVGFPAERAYSGMLEGEQELSIEIPADPVPGSLEVELNLYLSTFSDLLAGLESILKEPTGCFEQASSSNYPNVLTLQYLQEHKIADPDVTRRARELLHAGYGKLLGYECKGNGYEWFGGDPGHEALTAYGLMEFHDMAKVYPVDAEMMRRTANWLLARRDGKGGYLSNENGLDGFGTAPKEVTDAYITWALAEAGEKGIETELTHALDVGRRTNDPYVLALSAGALLRAGRQAEGDVLLAKLATLRAEDHFEGKDGSITRSGGISLGIETTALAALAFLQSEMHLAQAADAIDWIVKNRQPGGGFGSTQGTILALKALVAYSQKKPTLLKPGLLTIRHGGETLAEREFNTGERRMLTLRGLEAKLKPGENRLSLSLTGENRLPYSLAVRYRTNDPENDDSSPIRLSTSLANHEIKAGETVALSAKIRNTTDQGQPMTVAILGIPAGLEARTEQLEELRKSKRVDYYETRPREVIFYWRSLAPKQTIDVKLDLIAEIPGKFTGPASRAYLYYTAEAKQWARPLTIAIARQER